MSQSKEPTVSDRALTILIYGPTKIGKSSFFPRLVAGAVQEPASHGEATAIVIPEGEDDAPAK